MDGLLVVDKPPGITSRRAVDVARRLARERTAGHGGTLDPLAEGVLIVALGKATRLLEYLTSLDKRYSATAVLGATSATDDAEGPIEVRDPAPDLPARRIEAAMESLRGEISQRPPAFSAVSVEGQRLYAAARAGRPIEAPRRTVTVYGLELTAWESPRLDLRVHCSKGTYVRSLVRDLGESLGCGAYVERLRREAVGRFVRGDAHTLAALEETRDRIGAFILPPAAALDGWPALRVGPAHVDDLLHGRAISARPADGDTPRIGRDDRVSPGARYPTAREPSPPACVPERGDKRAAALSPGGELVAVVEWREGDKRWQPIKVFGTSAS